MSFEILCNTQAFQIEGGKAFKFYGTLFSPLFCLFTFFTGSSLNIIAISSYHPLIFYPFDQCHLTFNPWREKATGACEPQSGHRASHSGQRASNSGQRASNSDQRASNSGQRASNSDQRPKQSEGIWPL